MDATGFANCLKSVLAEGMNVDESFGPARIRRVETYREVGMLTTAGGLVVTMDDGTEFQLTIIQS